MMLHGDLEKKKLDDVQVASYFLLIFDPQFILIWLFDGL